MVFQLLISSLLWMVLLFFFVFIITRSTKTKESSSGNNGFNLPKSYPLVGAFFAAYPNRHRLVQWTASILQNAPSATFTLKRLSTVQVITANPANVEHILKTHFQNYPKGIYIRTALFDFLGHGIFNVDGNSWKLQRQVSSHEFSTKSLRKFVETAVDMELSDRLIPILSAAAADNMVLDFQDILQRFAFDNICKIAFGYDPEYLMPSLPEAEFACAFNDAVQISTQRVREPTSLLWRIKRFLNVGSEKRLRVAIRQVHEFASNIIIEKKKELKEKINSCCSYDEDLLSRFLSSGEYEDDFVRDIVISFILAGGDTTSAALTWFFWLLSRNPEAETQILEEIGENSDSPVFEDIKYMVYTHAALCESMRFYPPVPLDGKSVDNDDVWPDGTVVRKGMRATYHVFAMGRMESIWGSDWAEYRPERWLKRSEEGKWVFVGKHPYSYPVFQAGPRVCLGKEMAFLQMKRVVARVLRRFKVVPVITEESFEPEYVGLLTAKMEGGFPVRIEERREG